jgi:hypothetical protein
MGQGVDIDFGALKAAPDFAGNYVNAFKVGQDLGKASAVENAVPPPAVSKPISSDETRDSAAGHLPRANAPQQLLATRAVQAQALNEQLAHVLIGLKQYPPSQRLGIARHLARMTGLIDPDSISSEDVTDTGIDAHLTEAIKLERFLSQMGLQGSDAIARDQGALSQAITTPSLGGQDAMDAKFTADAYRGGLSANMIAPEEAMISKPVRTVENGAASRATTGGVAYIGPVS